MTRSHIMKYQVMTAGFALAFFSAFAQSSITGPAINSTASTSTGGGFSLTGNIGQPVVGKGSNGNFSVQSGAVTIVSVVPNPAGPALALNVTTTNTVVLHWPYPSNGFQLDQAPVVSADAWTSVTNKAVQLGSKWQVILDAPAGNRFYRLRAKGPDL